MDRRTNGPVTIRVLGPVDVRRGNETITVASTMQRRLLAALAMAHGVTVSTDALVAALWQEDPPATARNSLQSHVARLRDVLGPRHGVVTRPPGYGLDLGDVVVDAVVFEERIRHADRLLDTDPHGVVEEVTSALAVWRGEAYGEFAGELAREEATRLEELRATAMELLVRAQLATGATGAAVDNSRRLVSSAPYRESAALLTARALADDGRVPDALDVLRRHRERLADELGLDPSGAVGELEEALLRATPASPTPRQRSITPDHFSQSAAPPRRPEAVVGRAEDHRRVVAALEAGPLVTILGTGGVGKTTLAHLVATGVDRAVWIELGALRRDDDVSSTIADALGLTPAAGVRDAVVEALAHLPGIVVLDNCEHVRDTVADLVDAVLGRQGPGRIVVTSRQRLAVAGEFVVRLGPLPVPEPATATETDPAVVLFRDRLAAAGGPPVTPATAARVAAAVDGLPLALELAAARAASLPVEALLSRLPRNLDLLGGGVDRDGRHSTLRRVISWSHDMLEPREQVLFRRLSVFTATFRLEDVEGICADERLERSGLPLALSHLVDASMVARVGPDRFRLLEPLRLFAASELSSHGETDAVQRCQRDAVTAVVDHVDAAMAGPDEAASLAVVEPALSDIRAVLARTAATGDLTTVAHISGGLYRFAYLQARTDILRWGASLLDDDVAHDVSPDLRARALAAAATGAWMIGDLDQAKLLAGVAETLAVDPWARINVKEVAAAVAGVREELEDSFTRYRELLDLALDMGHLGFVAAAHLGLSLVHYYREESAESEAQARSAVEAAGRARAASIGAQAHYALGEALTLRSPSQALVALGIAQELAAEGHFRLLTGVARTAEVALRGRHGNADDAVQLYTEAVASSLETGADGIRIDTLRNLVVLLVRVGADADAVTLDASLRRLGTNPTFGLPVRDLEDARVAAQERLADDVYARAQAHGGRIKDLGAAAGFALDVLARLRAERQQDD